MKTILFSTCYLEGNDKSGSSRLLRTIAWVHYYSFIRRELGIDQIVLLDNGSSDSMVNSLTNHCRGTGLIVNRAEHLAGNHNQADYPYCWRGIYYLKTLIKMPDCKIEKIISIDTDSYVLTKRLAHFVRDLNHDWVSFESKMYGWPLSEFHVLSQAHFNRFLQFVDGNQQDFIRRYNGRFMERELPFTLVMTHPYNCDRYGEARMAETPDMDFYSQRPTDIQLVYNMAKL